jgi:pyrroline-5-carboxylate reductase
MKRVALLGGGRMGEALIGGLLDAGWESEMLAVAEVDADRRRLLETTFAGVHVVPSPAWAVAEANVVVVAVKHHDVASALESAAPALAEDAMILSIAAGVTLETLETALPHHAVVRAMPNTPALIRAGVSAIAGGTLATDADLDLAERVLGAVGVVVRLPEKHLDAVTGLSGSGPAYVFLLAEAMIEAGVLVGLPRDQARILVDQTLLGASRLLAVGDDHPEQLRAAVTSPGGTTAAGLAQLEAGGFRFAVMEAVRAATERSRELGREPT